MESMEEIDGPDPEAAEAADEPEEDEEFIFKEIHVIGQAFISHPLKKIPSDLCPREEIVAPNKVEAVMNIDEHLWTDTTYNGCTFKKLFVPWHKSYEDYNRIYSVAFYVLCENPAMFFDLNALGEGYGSLGASAIQIEAWLHTWARTPVVFTSPLLMYNGRRNIPLYYTVTNSFPSDPHYITPLEECCTQLLENDAYSIANGLTLAIAMQRNGVWSGENLHRALVRYFANLDDIDIFTVISDGLTELYMAHVYPQIADHPNLYANCFPLADDHVRRLLTAKYNPDNTYVIQYFDEQRCIEYVTSERIVRGEFPPADCGFRDKVVPDCATMFKKISDSKACLRWYRRNAEVIFGGTDELGSHKRKVAHMILRRLCFMYTRRPCRRLHGIFRDMLGYFGITASKWFIETQVMKLAEEHYIFYGSWIPWMPIAFLKDALEVEPFTQRGFSVLTMRPTTLCHVFGKYITTRPADNLHLFQRFGLKISNMEMLRLCPPKSSCGILNAALEKRTKKKLTIVYKAADQFGGSALWEPLRAFFARGANREALTF